jgi:hypothetical protein
MVKQETEISALDSLCFCTTILVNRYISKEKRHVVVSHMRIGVCVGCVRGGGWGAALTNSLCASFY